MDTSSRNSAENAVVFVHVQHWDIENLLNVHWLRSAAERRGSLNFLDDHLLLEKERGVQEAVVVHLFNHLQHRGIESLDEVVADARVPLQLPVPVQLHRLTAGRAVLARLPCAERPVGGRNRRPRHRQNHLPVSETKSTDCCTPRRPAPSIPRDCQCHPGSQFA